MINEKQKKIIIKSIIMLVICVIVGISFIFKNDIELWLNYSYNKNLGSSLNSDLSIHFIDVGQADATLIELPDGKFMMIDTGLNKNADSLVRYTEDVIQGNKKQIDYLVLTHHHEDHIGGTSEILESFEVKTIFRPKVYSTNEQRYNNWLYTDNTLYSNVIEKIKIETYNGIKSEIIYNSSDINITGDDYKISFIAPLYEYYEIENNYSAVILLEYKDKKILFGGDIEEDVEKDIVKIYDELKVNILKVSHHGSNSSSCQEFLNQLQPDYAVISCGRNNEYSHPSKSVLSRLEKCGIKQNNIYRTDRNGHIIIGFSDDETTISLQYTHQLPFYIYLEYLAITVVVLTSLILFLPKPNKKTFKNFFKKKQ